MIRSHQWETMRSLRHRGADRWRGCDLRTDLPSNAPGQVFHASMQIEWWATSKLRHIPDTAAAARAQIRERAAHLTRPLPVTDAEAARDLLSASLGARPRHTPRRGLAAWLTSVELTVDGDALTLERRLRTRARTSAAALDSPEIARAVAFHDLVLAEPGILLTHLLLSDPKLVPADNQDKLKGITAHLAGLSPEGRWIGIARTLDRFMTGLDAKAKEDVIAALGTLFHRMGRDELTQELPSEPAG